MSSKDNKSNTVPGHISIDSLKIRMPIEFVKIVNPSLEGSWVLVNTSTGEQDPNEFKKNALTIKEKGATTRFAIEHQQTRHNKTKEFITILVNSKELKGQYFEGINKQTIKAVYDSLMHHKIIDVPYIDFYNLSEVTDVDFKKDARVPIDIYTKCINECRSISKPSKSKSKGYRYFNSKDNKGIEWSDRRTTAYKSNPYLKIYHKQIELENNSSEFADAYLKDIDYTDITRVETTVKNAAHFRHLGVNSNKLIDVLKLSQIELNGIINMAIKSHLEPRIRKPKSNNKLKPFEMIIYGSILLSMKSGVSYESYQSNVLGLIENKTERNRKRKVLDMIYDRFIKGTMEDKTSQEKDVFWSFINW